MRSTYNGNILSRFDWPVICQGADCQPTRPLVKEINCILCFFCWLHFLLKTHHYHHRSAGRKSNVWWKWYPEQHLPLQDYPFGQIAACCASWNNLILPIIIMQYNIMLPSLQSPSLEKDLSWKEVASACARQLRRIWYAFLARWCESLDCVTAHIGIMCS